MGFYEDYTIFCLLLFLFLEIVWWVKVVLLDQTVLGFGLMELFAAGFTGQVKKIWQEAYFLYL